MEGLKEQDFRALQLDAAEAAPCPPSASAPAAPCATGAQLEFDLTHGRDRIAERLAALPDGADTPFQSRAWLAAWTAALECDQGVLATADLAETGERLFLPLSQRSLGPVRLLESAMPRQGPVGSCSIALTDTHPLQSNLWRRLRQRLGSAGLHADALVLYDLPEHQAQALPQPCHVAERRTSHGFSLAGKWETIYATAFSKKARSEFGRRERKLARELGDVGFDILTAPDEQQEAVRTLIDWKRRKLDSRKQPSTLTYSHVQRFIEALPASFDATDEHSLIIVRLSAGGSPVAFNLGLRHKTTFYGLIMAHDEDIARKYGAGNILLNKLMEHLCREGVTWIDMGHGEQEFKQALAEQSVDTLDIVVPLTAAGHAYAAASRLLTPLRQRLRDNPLARRLYFSATRGSGMAPSLMALAGL